MYRIIAGRWKSKRVSAPKNFTVRPTTDFAKEALFSILDHRKFIAGSRVLDLFGGLGSISLEFASRGASHITCVEQNPKHIGFIRDTAKELELDSVLDLQRADVYSWLKKHPETGRPGFDFIFADPPFDTADTDYQNLIKLIQEKKLLAEDGILMIEHQAKRNPTGVAPDLIRKYGNVSFTILTPEDLAALDPSKEA